MAESHDYSININFITIIDDKFNITLYRKSYEPSSRPEVSSGDVVMRRLQTSEGYTPFWTSFENFEDSEKVVVNSYENNYLSVAYLERVLIARIKDVISEQIYETEKDFRKKAEIITENFEDGFTTVSIEPYYLKAERKFGFLINFRFRSSEQSSQTRELQKMSLSLDHDGHANLNYYVDRQNQITSFLRETIPKLFPLSLSDGSKINVATQLNSLSADLLSERRYIVGNETETESQFSGVSENGPCYRCDENFSLCFVYSEPDHRFAQELFKALRGDTFSTFKGMELVFNLGLNQNNVNGITISGYSDQEIEQLSARVFEYGEGMTVIPVILTPFSKTDLSEESKAYWKLKHAFLNRGLPIQVVSRSTISNRNKLKWATSSIALQIFAKAGGLPWKVRSQNSESLIVGIGQAHEFTEDRKIVRYYAYSVLSDSSGTFRELRLLGKGNREDEYLSNFRFQLERILDDYSQEFSKFVIHAPFTLRRSELDVVANTLSDKREAYFEGDLVSMKFNTHSRFLGFSTKHNSRVPLEGSIVQLSRNDFLVWFEGLNQRDSTVRKRYGLPVHVAFTYPTNLPHDLQRSYLQDSLNLAGANWRGFQARSLPISVFYSQIIARYLKEFSKLGLSEPKLRNMAPWFL